jgi:hypothetical protein
VPYPSPAAEATALAHGQITAAWIDPVAAITAWQATRGHIRIIAGAASGTSQLIAARWSLSFRKDLSRGMPRQVHTRVVKGSVTVPATNGLCRSLLRDGGTSHGRMTDE